jgi:acetyltransferase-like isoleucine patch superfamily enzyme
MKFVTEPFSQGRIARAANYLLGYAQFRLYGVVHAGKLRANRVILLNRGTIVLGYGVSLGSYPDGTAYTCSLRTYFPESRIEIGDRCLLNGAVLHSNRLIKLGAGVLMGPGSILVDNDSHPPVQSHQERYSQRPPEAPIHLHDNVWIGMRATVMKGVTIGENTIVAANAVVTKNLPANVVAAGIPARPIADVPATVADLQQRAERS